jgi:hypothetical protein
MKKLFIASLVLFTFSSCSDENLNPTAVQNKVEPSYVADQLLIKFKPTEAGGKTTTNILSLIGATTVEVINTNSMIATNAKTNATGGKLY